MSRTDPPGTFYDGDHTVPFLCKPPLRWEDPETRAEMTKLTYRVRQPFYKILPRLSRNVKAKGAYLVEQGQPTVVGGDLYEYTLTFATLPNRPDEALPYVMNYQAINGDDLVELPVPMTARASYRYYATSNPFTLKLKRAWRLEKAGAAMFYVGTKPAKGAKTWLAEDETLKRWMGDIWEVRSVIVPAPDFVQLTN